MNISYSLKRETNQYGDIRDDIQRLVEANPNQMSFDEYVYIYNLIESKADCNLLVFGLGKDSDMWMKCNNNNTHHNNPNKVNYYSNKVPL